MKKSLIALLLVVVVACVGLAACNPDDPDVGGGTTIAQILTEKSNNDSVTAKGTVFGVVTGGFYLMDDSTDGYIFVNTADKVAVGDKVTVEGTFGTGSVKPPQIKAVTSLTKDGTATVSLTAAPSSVAAVCGMNKDAATGVYGKYVTLTGTVETDTANRLSLADEDGNSVLFFTGSAVSELANFHGKRVELKVVIHGYTGGKFLVSYIGTAAEITERPLSAADVKDEVVEWVEQQVGHERTGSFTLPLVYQPVTSITLSWSVETNDYLVINGGVATVATLDNEQQLTLKLKINTTETDFVEVDYTITLKPVTLITISELLENQTLDGQTVMVKGIVMTYLSDGNNQAVREGFMLYDSASGKMVAVSNGAAVGGSHGSYLATDGTAYGVGDEITVVGKYSLDTAKIGNSGPSQTGRRNIDLTDGSVTVETKSISYNLDAAKTAAAVIDSGEDLAAFAENLQFGQLIKLVGTTENPLYVGMSASSFPVNFKLLYQPGTSNDDCKFAGPNGNSYIFSIKSDINQINAINNWWETAFGIRDAEVCPKDGVEAKPVTGEVYVVVSHWTGTYYQLAIVDWANSTLLPRLPANELAELEIEAAFPNKTIDATAAGAVTLPAQTTHAGAITWTADPADIINLETGAFAAQETSQTVTLTAHFNVGGTDYTYDIELLLQGATFTDVTVSQALEAAGDTVASLKAYIAAFGTSSANADEQRAGLILTDGEKAIWYNTSSYSAGGADIKIGDEVRIVGGTLDRADGARRLNDGTLTVLNSDNTINFANLAVDATISNETEMVAYAAASKAKPGQIVKFIGDFFFVGTGSSNDNCRYQITYKSTAASSAAARYTFDIETEAAKYKTFSFSVRGNEYLLGDWWTPLGMPKASGSKSFAVTGSFYAVSCGAGNTMYAWSIINADAWNVSPVTAAE